MTVIGGLFQGLGLADQFGAGREQGVDVYDLIEEKHDEADEKLDKIEAMLEKMATEQAKLEHSVAHVEQAETATAEHAAAEEILSKVVA